MQAVATSALYGYTLLDVNYGERAKRAHRRQGIPIRSCIVPAANLADGALAMVVIWFPTKTVPEFINYAKANPGKINMASAGTGTGTHVAGELFKMMAGVNMQHVPYRGGAPVLTDLFGGQVQVYFGLISGLIEYVRADSSAPWR